MYSTPPPGSGVILTFIMNVLQGLIPAKDDNTLWQRVVETFKWAFARRTELADPDFVNISEYSVMSSYTLFQKFSLTIIFLDKVPSLRN